MWRQNGEEKNHKSCNQTRQGIFSAGRVMNVWLITKAISSFYYYSVPFFSFFVWARSDDDAEYEANVII